MLPFCDQDKGNTDMNTNILAECIGVCGFLATVVSYQCKSRKKILLLQLFSTTCWTIHFFLLGALSGAVLNAVGAMRCIVFASRGENNRAGKIADWIGWIPIFLGMTVLSTIFTWDGWISLLPFCGMILTTFALRAPTAKLVRLISLPNDPMWLAYNALCGSISGVITEVCIILSILVGMVRHDIRRK